MVPTRRLINLLIALIVLAAIPHGAVASDGLAGDVVSRTIGEMITIGGTTNLAAGDELIVTVRPLSFTPGVKDTGGEFSGVSGVVTVKEGEDANRWEFSIDTSGFQPDEYLVTVESIETGQTSSSTFTLVAPEPAMTAGTNTPSASDAIPSSPTPTEIAPQATAAAPPAALFLTVFAAIAAAFIRR